MNTIHPIIEAALKPFLPACHAEGVAPPTYPIAYVATKKDDTADLAVKLANLALDRSTPADSRDENSEAEIYQGSLWLDVTAADGAPLFGKETGDYSRSEYMDIYVGFNLIQRVTTEGRDLCRYAVWEEK